MKDANVYPRKDSPYWWVAFYCPVKLRRVWASTGERRDDPMGHMRALAMAREKSHEASAGKSAAGVARFSVWVEPWIREKHADSINSLNVEINRWHWLQLFLEQKKIRVPAGVTYQTALDYMEWKQAHVKRSGKKPGYNSCLQDVRGLGRIMREAVRRGFIQASPLERMNLKEKDPAEKPEITDAEVALIRGELAKREGHLPLRERWMTISFEIALHQGCRMAETSIPMERISLERGTMTLIQKGNRMFTTKLHAGLVPLIKDLQAAGATHTCILPKMDSKHWHWFFKGRRDSGHHEKGVAPHLTFHCTRVTVITRMARAGVPIAQAMAYVGHADETIHRIYQRLQAPDLDRCTQALAF